MKNRQINRSEGEYHVKMHENTREKLHDQLMAGVTDTIISNLGD